MRIHAFHRLFQYRQSISTKAFNARGAKVNRCQYCQVSSQHCICEFQPDIDTNIATMLIVSDNEVFKPSNTGKLIADVIKDTFVYQWNRTEPDPEMLKVLSDPSYLPIIVFPEDYVDDKQRLITSTSLEPTNLRKEKAPNCKPLFIFIDGSWREARKIFRKSEYLAGLPVLSIKPDSVSQYLMRKSMNEDHLSTAEVAALVLEQAGETQASKTLEFWFEAFRESYLLSKTRLKHDLTRPFLKRFVEYSKSAKHL
ncbi:tRNA-uridine aminocarboxypropyltransferase [Vibrio paucivorans]|uniref:tRNA-uridine aminocarboxypropyltransferase n=1 Tax=Vibrio paucivorans TaxID=2829489 RepID=A0A9X3CH96_9VIBR|nr:tRNA-uridine aminocarboxypropyltransferase [Vibrio paucivorans]MCW8335828.1 DTW domain-containing protein [Vibrio paucivorans]